MQLDFVNITGPADYNNYTDESTYNWFGQLVTLENYKDGLGDLGTYIKGSCFNLRIGRGMVPTATNADRATFTQVQGGRSDVNNTRAYKLVV